MRRIAALTLGLVLAVSGLALAQTGSGNLYGSVADDKGQPLPGATVTVTGGTIPAVQVTDGEGNFRFLNLAPGSYKLEASLEGFSNVVYENAVIAVGRNTTIEVKMSSAVTETVTVTGESPLLDTRKVATGATLNQAELQKVPSAKDPWTILQTVPGVLVDRINVGGSESGQQSGYTSPGASAAQSQWNIDGVAITDFGAQGSSPAYFDFDAFEEMNFSTGGSDAQTATPGVSINIVTKRGTNAYRAEVKYETTSSSWQSDNSPTGSDLGPGQPAFRNGNQIDHIQNRDFQLSGPIWKDHIWLWAAYGKQQINKLNPAGATDFSKDQTELESKNAKLNAQITNSNSLSATYFNNDKVKLGRNIGLLAQSSWVVQDANATADQGKPSSASDPSLQKAEDTQIFGSNFFLTGTYAKVNGSFGFTPKGGSAMIYFDSNLGLHNNTYVYNSIRPQKLANLDGSAFFNTGAWGHELKFGAGYRKAEVNSQTRLTAGGFVSSDANFCYVDCDPNRNIFIAVRDGAFNYQDKNTTAYAQDTLTHGNLTLNVGLHYDRQEGEGLAGAVGANKWAPSILPAITAPAAKGATWTNLLPRLGVTYALGAEKKTLLRASYSRYADGLGPRQAYWNILGFGSYYTYAAFYTTNTNGLNFDASQIGAFIPGQTIPTPAPVSFTKIDGDLKAPTTDELLLGVEHSLLPEFTVGANLTYRKYRDPVLLKTLVQEGSDPGPGEGRPATAADYDAVPVTLANGRVVTGYKLKSNLGYYTTNDFMTNGDYGQTYMGVALTATKRLSNGWMARGNVSYNDWKWDVSNGDFPNGTIAAGQTTAVRDGDQVIAAQGGSGKANVFVNAKYSYSITGLYQLMPDKPWGFDIGGTLYGRQGFPYVEAQTVKIGAQGLDGNSTSYSFQTTASPDSKRQSNINLLDVRLSKDVKFGHFGGTVALDCFNVLNSNTALATNRSLTSAQHNWTTEIISPRVLKVGLTVNFE